jgi:hypothetical protein
VLSRERGREAARRYACFCPCDGTECYGSEEFNHTHTEQQPSIATTRVARVMTQETREETHTSKKTLVSCDHTQIAEREETQNLRAAAREERRRRDSHTRETHTFTHTHA